MAPSADVGPVGKRPPPWLSSRRRISHPSARRGPSDGAARPFFFVLRRRSAICFAVNSFFGAGAGASLLLELALRCDAQYAPLLHQLGQERWLSHGVLVPGQYSRLLEPIIVPIICSRRHRTASLNRTVRSSRVSFLRGLAGAPSAGVLLHWWRRRPSAYCLRVRWRSWPAAVIGARPHGWRIVI